VDATSVALRPVDRRNVLAVCRLRLGPGQEASVAPAAYTVAEAAYEPDAWLRAIVWGEDVVGVLLLTRNDPAGKYKLVRLLVDAPHQRSGVGRAAVGLVAAHLRTVVGAERLVTSHRPGVPTAPAGFYERLGFQPTGTVDEHGEPVLALPLRPR
jgi:diamine N-acetyltransferase